MGDVERISVGWVGRGLLEVVVLLSVRVVCVWLWNWYYVDFEWVLDGDDMKVYLVEERFGW